MTETAIEYVRCWWCGDVLPSTELVHLDGAVILGERLDLPARIPEEDRKAIVVCQVDRETGAMKGCVARFVRARHAHDLEVAQVAAVRSGKPDGIVELLGEIFVEEELDQVERLHGKTVADGVREYLRRKKESDG